MKKETLDASLPSMVGTPVIIKHQDVTKANADKLRCGTISRAFFNEPDGWYYCEGIIWDEEAIELINKGWSVSCSYDFLSYNDEGGEENNIHYDKEFTQLNFTHLAIVDNPRYERANIIFNSKINNFSESKVNREPAGTPKGGQFASIKGFHGSNKDFEKFSEEKDWHFLSSNYTIAKSYAKPNEGIVYEAEINLQNPYIFEANGNNWGDLNKQGLRTNDIARKAKAEGYDGVIIKDLKDIGREFPYHKWTDEEINILDTPHTDYIVFNPKDINIKSKNIINTGNIMDINNAKDWDNNDGEWVTIKGNHIFIPDGKSLDEVIKEKGWGDKEKNKETSKDEDYKREADIALTMMAQDYEKRGNQGTVNRANELKEKLKNGEELTERDKAHIKMALDTYKPREHTKEAKQRKDKINELRETLKGIARKNEKDEQSISYVPIDPVSYGKEHTQYWGVDETGKTQYTTENKQKIYGVGLYKDYNGKEKLGFYIDYSDKPHWEVKKEPENLLSYYGEPNAMTPEQFDDVYKKVIKSLKKNKTDNSKETDKMLLDELKKLIFKVENNKENEMEIDEKVENAQVDKRKLIDEVAGIMKSAGCDDEVIRTAIGKMEKIGYDASEDSKADNKKVKNEEDKEEEKEKVDNKEEDKKDDVENKCKNEAKEDKEKVEEVKEDVKEDVDNKCKNSKGTSSFDKINEIYNSVREVAQKSQEFVSRQEKLDNAVEYFK